MKDCLMINSQDNVGIALRELQTGETVTAGERTIVIKETILKGHKFALKDIAENEDVIKYGFPIGHATDMIQTGEWVHTKNV